MDSYCGVIHDHLDSVEGDPIQTLQLLPEYQTKMVNILSAELNVALESSAMAKRSATDDLLKEFKQAQPC